VKTEFLLVQGARVIPARPVVELLEDLPTILRPSKPAPAAVTGVTPKRRVA